MYWPFDIETIPDGELIKQCVFPGKTINRFEAIEAYQEELLEKSDGRSDFIPYTYHLPVSVAVGIVNEQFELEAIKTFDRPTFNPETISRRFWKHVESKRPCLVTFNGRGFDLPVMEQMAYKFGISLPHWHQKTKYPSDSPRNRYQTHSHIDLQEFLTNFGSARSYTGGLNLASNIIGAPGKIDTKGSMVWDLYKEGNHEAIDDYCICDILDTYWCFLRSRVVTCQLTLEREAQIRTQAMDVISQASETYPVLNTWLEHLTKEDA
jgi:predicted PolB exonuclease-like 3'-5' exonuclease